MVFHNSDSFFACLNKFVNLEQFDYDGEFERFQLCHPNLKNIYLKSECVYGMEINCPRLECLYFYDNFCVLTIIHPETIKHLGYVCTLIEMIMSIYHPLKT